MDVEGESHQGQRQGWAMWQCGEAGEADEAGEAGSKS